MKFARVAMLLIFLVALATPVYALGSDQQVTIPDDLRAALVVAVTAFFSFWFTEGIKSLSALIAQWAKFWPPLAKLDISGWGSALTAFCVSVGMYYVDKGLGILPPLFAPLAPFVVQAVIALLAMGTHTVLKQFRPAAAVPALPLNVKQFQPK